WPRERPTNRSRKAIASRPRTSRPRSPSPRTWPRIGISLWRRGGLMLFKLDENLHPDIGEPLKQLGHEVATVCDEGLRGRDAHMIAEACRAEERILISLDLDFSDIRMFPPENYREFSPITTAKWQCRA